MEARKNDVGVILRGTVKEGGTPLDVSAATLLELLLTPPRGEPRTRAVVFFTDGSDGIVDYVTVGGDLNVVGTWQVQIHAVFATGLDVTSAAVELIVGRAPR